MMNDRFSAQLRQHLVESANERPAEGQIAAILAQVATTPQPRPWVARLPGLRGWIGQYPAAARYGLIAVALVLAAVAGAILAVGLQTRPSTPFEGTWTGIDIADGSTLNLYVGAGASPTVRFEDLLSTGTVCSGAPVKVLTANGYGEISGGDRLEVSYPDGGSCGEFTTPFAGVYQYDAATDTLVDQAGIRWIRPAGSVDQRPPPASPDSTADCADISDGTYEVLIGGSMVTADVPPGWYGLRDEFHLERGSCGARAEARVQVSVVSVVYADACNWRDAGIDVATPDEAAAALVAQTGRETVVPTDFSLAGYLGRRFDITLPAEVDAPCDDGTFALWGSPGGDGSAAPRVPPGRKVSMFLLDVDGQAIAVAATHPIQAATPDANDQVVSIIASIQIEPGLRTTPAPLPDP